MLVLLAAGTLPHNRSEHHATTAKKGCTTTAKAVKSCHKAVHLGILLPTGIAVGVHGNIFVADSGHGRILKISPDGQVRGRWGSAGTGPGQFAGPNLLAVDAHGNVYVADSGNNRVEKLSSAGRPSGQWGGKGTGPGQLDNPLGVALDGRGDLYVTDAFNDRIQRIPLGGGAATAVQLQSGLSLRHPSAIAIDSQGDLYVSDPGNHRIVKLSSGGRLLAQWGADVGLNKPAGIALDAHGNIYVADRAADRIQKLSPGGHPLARWGALGTAPGQLQLVSHGHVDGIALDARGDIFVADTGNNRIQELSPAGKVLAVWT